MQVFSISPREMVASIWRHRALASALVKREVVGRYLGSVMVAWAGFVWFQKWRSGFADVV